MSSLGEPWDESTPGSASKKNLTSVISMEGDDLALLDKTKFKILACTATGSGFTVDHVYLTTADGTSVVDVTSVLPHKHGSDTDGGSISEIDWWNNTWMDLCLTKTTDLYEANWASAVFWIRTVTSTGSVENSTDGTTGERSIRLRPNGTSGSGATISYPHLKLDFSKRSFFETKLRIETATSLALHSGVGADDVTAADSNTRKYNAEVCTATNSNWFIRTANGSANSTSDTGVAISTNRVAIHLNHLPELGTPETDLYVDGTIFQKTTHIPVDSTTASNNIIKHSIKNSTAADRPMHTYGTRLRYWVSDNWD